MLILFDKKYKACSNLFVHTVEDEKFVYPAPLSIYASIEDEQRQLKNQIRFKFNSYYDSILTLDFHFSVFMYLLTYEYRMETILIEGLQKEELVSESNGYGGIYNFMNTSVLLNIGEQEIYDDYKKATV